MAVYRSPAARARFDGSARGTCTRPSLERGSAFRQTNALLSSLQHLITNYSTTGVDSAVTRASASVCVCVDCGDLAPLTSDLPPPQTGTARSADSRTGKKTSPWSPFAVFSPNPPNEKRRALDDSFLTVSVVLTPLLVNSECRLNPAPFRY